MKKLNQMKKQANKGFTLIELMIVIAIIGILASVAIPQYQQYTRSANGQTIVTKAASLKTAVGLCVQLNGGNLANCDAGAERIPTPPALAANETGVTGVANGVINMLLGDLDGDGIDETVALTPVVGPTGIVWGVVQGAGSDPCARTAANADGNDWIDCNEVAYNAAVAAAAAQ